MTVRNLVLRAELDRVEDRGYSITYFETWELRLRAWHLVDCSEGTEAYAPIDPDGMATYSTLFDNVAFTVLDATTGDYVNG